MTQYKLKKLQAAATAYFANCDNRPFSVLEVCNELGISYLTLRQWYLGKEEAFRSFASSIYSRVGVSWEKGEISPSLATALMKQYLDNEPVKPQPEEFVIRIVEDGV